MMTYNEGIDDLEKDGVGRVGNQTESRVVGAMEIVPMYRHCLTATNVLHDDRLTDGYNGD